MNYEGVTVQVSDASPTIYAGQSASSAYSGGFERGNKFSTSGIATLDEGIERVCEGGYVFDKRDLSMNAQIDSAVCGAMLDCTLPPLTISVPFDGNKIFDSLEEALACEATHKSFTYVSLDIYAAQCRAIGAKVGRKINGEIKWA